jgi:hypothetical protein
LPRLTQHELSDGKMPAFRSSFEDAEPEVYWRQRRYDEAEHALIDGLKLDERNWHGHFTLGRLYWDKGDAVRAGPSIGRTLQLKPDFA